MAPVVLPETAFHIALDTASQLLAAHWNAPVAEAELPSHFADLLTAARHHGKCRFWLLDLRGRHWFSTQVGQWLGTTFAAQAAQAIGLPIFIACVLDPLHHEVAKGPGAAASQRACAAHDFYPFFFSNEGDARSWLQDQQQLDHVPGSCQAQVHA
jgi:hypothetical protein